MTAQPTCMYGVRYDIHFKHVRMIHSASECRLTIATSLETCLAARSCGYIFSILIVQLFIFYFHCYRSQDIRDAYAFKTTAATSKYR